MNAFLNWLLTEGFIIRPIRLKKLKTTKKVLVILTNEQVEKLIRYQPKKKIQRRVHVMVPLILDCGMRVDEVLHVNKEDVDLDNLLIKVRKGKGDKQRIVPITLPMRKHLYRYLKSESHPKSQFVFSTALGSAQAYRNANRILKSIGESIGLPELRFHLLRHTFATNFISMGGNVVILKKILGHASLATTMIYEHLQTADLQVAHHQHSLVGKLG
jgi:integrase/recombinase XerD